MTIRGTTAAALSPGHYKQREPLGARYRREAATLVLNRLRGRITVKRRPDETGARRGNRRALGADEFARHARLCQGCIMMRKCHRKPVGWCSDAGSRLRKKLW